MGVSGIDFNARSANNAQSSPWMPQLTVICINFDKSINRVFRLCGGHYWLGTCVISHWAFGPSRVLLEVSPRARTEALPPLFTREKSMCFGLSKPGAASDAAMLLDSGKPAGKELSMTKAYAVEIGARAVDRVIQAHGAVGFTNELELTEAWNYLRPVNVADGTNEILRRTILHRMLEENME